jgi:FixJ family two-component response regulator
MVSLMKSHGYVVRSFESAEDFIRSPHRTSTDCLIADMHMPGMTGIDLLGRLVAEGNPIPSILITARHDESIRRRAKRVGAFCYLVKPFGEDELLKCVRSAVADRKTGSCLS